MHKTKLQIIYIFTISAMMLLPGVCSAGIGFRLSQSEVPVHGQFKVDAFLDTEGETMNAVEGRIVFPPLIGLKEISDGSSCVSFWVEKPAVSGGTEVRFSGITPGGYEGEDGFLFSLYFEALSPGEADIAFSDVKVLADDGKATELELASEKARLIIKEGDGKALTPSPQMIDQEAPEPFQIFLGRDGSLFSGRWFISFASQDKASGIREYLVSEESLIKKKSSGFKPAASPYLLADQELLSRISVKAVDRAGNETVSVLEPADKGLVQKKLAQKDLLRKALIAAGLLILAVLILVITKKRRKR